MNADAKTNRALTPILLGGLVAGTCDLVYAVSFYGLQGVPPARILQSVASGLLGIDSYRGGWASAVLGLALHFLIAFGAAAFYYLASRKMTVLISRAPLFGALYGAAIFFFLRKVVLPLSAAPPFQWTALAAGTDLAVHILFIGLPIALLVRRYGAKVEQPPLGSRL
ncbi:MAG: hypothetical protein H0W66_06295 [Chthoniobacterales bacterium]|nr:hypothetical protein [Chthoniobacterales bacterium]